MKRSKRPVDSVKIHAASSGEYASDIAVQEGRVEVVLVDETGRRESYGRLVARRRVGGYLVQLASDPVHRMRWVIASRVDPGGSGPIVLGFGRGRTADAREVFDHVTEAELDQGPARSAR